MENDIDIYEDLPSFGGEFNEIVATNHPETNTAEQAELKRQIAKLTSKLEDFRKVNENLELNLVSLLKTAKAEIARKDKMIDNLRKELDDVTFRRSAYFKRSNRVSKFTSNDTVATAQHKTAKVPLPVRENDYQSLETNLSYNLTKNSNLNKSISIPRTVFSERLYKRIAEEQNLEKREKQLNKLNDRSKIPSIQGYIVDSDKENGSLADTGSSNTREMQSSKVKQYSESEQSTVANFSAERDNEANFRLEQPSVFVADVTRKRTNDEAYTTACIKRFKSEDKECTSKSGTKITRENAVNSSNEMEYDFSEINSERRRTMHIDSEHNRYSSNQDNKRHSYLPSINYVDKTDPKDTDEYTSKRNCKSVVSTNASEEKNSSQRSLDLPMNEAHRPGIAENRRIKRTEDHRVNEIRGDRRSRGRQPSCENYREEKHVRNKYKYASYEEKSEKRYDTRGTSSAVKSKTIRKESYDSRNVAKQLIAKGNSTRNVQLSDRCDDYESRVKERLRSFDKTTQRDKRQDECNQYSSHRTSVRKKLTEDGRQSGTVKHEKAVETNKHVERINRRKFAENGKTPLKSNDSSQDSIKDKKPSKSSKTDVDKVKDGRSDNRDNCLNSKTKSRETSNDEKTEEFLNLKSVTVETDLSRAFTTVVSLEKQPGDVIENAESNENVENVENIEKFIRNYTSNNEHLEKNPDERDATSALKTKNECESVKKDAPKDKTNFEEQKRDTTCLDLKQRDATTKLCATESGDTFRQFLQQSDQTDDRIKMNETTVTVMTESTRNTHSLATDGNCTAQIFVDPLKNNYSTDFAADETSENFTTGTVSVTSTTDNTSQSIVCQLSEQTRNGNDCDKGNGNDNDKGNDKSNTESCIASVFKDSDADNINGNSNYDIHDLYKDNRNIDIQEKNIGDNCPNVTQKETTNDQGREDPLPKLIEQVGYKKEEEEKTEIGKGTIEKGLHESDKSLINNGTNAKAASMNVHGKIVVFARRKKPVCLANNNANMTVLINNCHSPNTS